MKRSHDVGYEGADGAFSTPRVGRLAAAVPSLMTVGGAAVFGTLWVLKIWDYGFGIQGGLTLVGGLAYIAWITVEARVSIRELGAPGETYDRGTLEMAAVAKQLLFLACLLPRGSVTLVGGLIGIAMIVSGGGFRTWAVARLGAMYTHRIRVPANGIVVSGPYRVVRHPAYLGTLIGHAGVVVLMPSPWSIGVLLLAWLPIVVVRTQLEDRLLLDRVSDYSDYRARTRWRLIPGVW